MCTYNSCTNNSRNSSRSYYKLCITDAEKNRKFVCVDTNDIPVVAIVDPDMMESMPKGLTASLEWMH